MASGQSPEARATEGVAEDSASETGQFELTRGRELASGREQSRNDQKLGVVEREDARDAPRRLRPGRRAQKSLLWASGHCQAPAEAYAASHQIESNPQGIRRLALAGEPYARRRTVDQQLGLRHVRRRVHQGCKESPAPTQ